LEERCAKCDVNVTTFTLNELDRRYYTKNGTSVDTLLNLEAAKKGYGLKWDRYLSLKKPFIVKIDNPVNQELEVFGGITLEENDVSEDIFKYHLIVKGSKPSSANEITKFSIVERDMELVPYHLLTIRGEMDGMVYAEPGALRNIDELKEYLQSNDYVVGDYDSRVVLDGESPISRDMNIVVMRRNIVVIDIEKTKPEDVNLTEIALLISDLTGIDVKDILVYDEVDEEGYVIRVIIILEDADQCALVISSVNNLEKGDTCKYGILCRSLGARLPVERESISFSSRTIINNGLVLISFFTMLLLV